MAIEADILPVLKAPLVQATLLYFRSGISDLEREKAASHVQELVGRTFHACHDVEAAYVGWSIEDDVPILDAAADIDQSGVALVLLVGWNGVEARGKCVSQFDFMHELKKSASLDSMIGELTRLIECRAFGTSR